MRSLLFRPLGLRTEIITNLFILVAASILLVGLLLLKLAERELVTERVARIRDVMELMPETPSGFAPSDIAWFMQGIPRDLGLQSYACVDRDLRTVCNAMDDNGAEISNFRLTRSSMSTEMRVNYHGWVPLGEPGQSDVLITVPLVDRQQRFTGAVQALFSLSDIQARILSAQQYILIYVVLVGLVLVLFGLILLSRSVISPIRRLMGATRTIAAGDLDHTVPERGPGEIASLSHSFNTMVQALKQSRDEAEQHIQSLQEANKELIETRKELILSERMASVGHLAAGMAHEVGNPLSSAVGYMEILKMRLDDPSQADLVSRALAEMQRIDRLVRDLLDYAAPGNGKQEPLDPISVMKEALDLLRHQGAFDGMGLQKDLPDSLPLISMERNKLMQVFVNLLLNARDASAGGTVRLAAEKNGRWVKIQVADDGVGMNDEVLAHIFDPFYTTKEPGKGRGLGLSVCHRVVEEAGGAIEVESELGMGSVFTLKFPLVEQQFSEGTQLHG